MSGYEQRLCQWTYTGILHERERNTRKPGWQEPPVATGRQRKETKSWEEIDKRGRRGLYAKPFDPFYLPKRVLAFHCPRGHCYCRGAITADSPCGGEWMTLVLLLYSVRVRFRLEGWRLWKKKRLSFTHTPMTMQPKCERAVCRGPRVAGLSNHYFSFQINPRRKCEN